MALEMGPLRTAPGAVVRIKAGVLNDLINAVNTLEATVDAMAVPAGVGIWRSVAAVGVDAEVLHIPLFDGGQMRTAIPTAKANAIVVVSGLVFPNAGVTWDPDDKGLTLTRLDASHFDPTDWIDVHVLCTD